MRSHPIARTCVLALPASPPGSGCVGAVHVLMHDACDRPIMHDACT